MSAPFEQRTLGEHNSSWWFFSYPRSGYLSLLVTGVVLGLIAAFAIWYSHLEGADTAPDSIVGLAFAVAGIICVVLAGVHYRLRRGRGAGAIGDLHVALNWHIYLAVIGFILLLLHVSGNLNPHSGTYALYGMVALVVSGILGRFLDRLLPWLITQEVLASLNVQGEDRIERITQELPIMAVPSATDFGKALQEHSLVDPMLDPTGLQVQAHPKVMQRVQRATQRELLYRSIIRYWRVGHSGLAVLTLLLTMWHVIYALQLLLH